MDLLDYQISEILDLNSRATNREIAQQLNISDKTIGIRVKRILDNGELKVSALVNIEKLSNVFQAIICIKIKQNTNIAKCISRINEIPHVLSVIHVTGRYDVIAVLIVNSREMLADILENKFDKIEAIQTIETLISLNNKNQWIPAGILYELI